MFARIAPYADLHTTLDGPGDQRPTALRIIQDEDLIGKWTDRTIFITGANQGIGLETARALHATGATLYLGVRSIAKGEAAKASILSTSTGTGPIHLIELSLDSLASVRTAAAAFLRRSPRLNILINNAGIMAAPHALTADGFESQLGTNHLGHFLLTSLLLPTLAASSTPSFASRVVNLSSAGHRAHADAQIDLTDLSWERRGYHAWRAYGAAKTANILHANRLDRACGPAVRGFSVNPGGIYTGLFRHLSEEEKANYEKWRTVFKSPEQGAATTVWCATAAVLEGKGGMYCEDCGEGAPADAEGVRRDITYAPWAKGDVEAEDKLWEISEKMVGLRQ
ncbi:Short-chain dehydrogenase/reductase SDR [Neofusicoccum parvum]|nr:Short-chain dehydrogenase/reductase SDR [Neofusicoccum parvum]